MPRLFALTVLVAVALALVPAARVLRGEESDRSLFAPSELRTSTGDLLDPGLLYPAEQCGMCHVQQHEDWKGSMHRRAHTDGIYLAFADRAREEGGDELYVFCSGCHAPGAVTTGRIPAGADDADTAWLEDEGVTCDVCHTANEVRTLHAGGGANASLTLVAGETRFGPLADPAPNPVHPSETAAVHGESKLCSACHTLTHPHTGVVIENTYAEWKKSPYAEAGITCQDCHMRTPEQAREVARTMKPLEVPGVAAQGVDERPDIKRHLFVGANVNSELTGASPEHARMAEERLKSAATVALQMPDSAPPGAVVPLTVAVTNVGAGHSIPTSITELREVWIDLHVTDAAGGTVFRSGAVDETTGAVDPDAVMYHSVLVDEEGEVTYLPWRAAKMVEHNVLEPKQTRVERYQVPVPPDARGPFSVRAVLRYRSAPQQVMDELFGKGSYPLRIVDMASADGTLR